MPTYVYRCERGHEFEREQRITDEPIKYCEIEGSMFCPDSLDTLIGPCAHSVQRVIQPGAFILTGGGWYSDGYSKTSSKKDKPK